MNQKSLLFAFVSSLLAVTSVHAGNEETTLLWGDTHLHTNLSADAYINGTTTLGPNDAYRWAKGLPVIHSYNKAKVQIDEPLDFLVVSDHAEYAGLALRLFQGNPEVLKTESGARFKKMIEAGQALQMFAELITTVNEDKPIEELNSKAIRKSVWDEIIDAAEKHNDPGKFTTFIGWEWSSLPDGANLHRVVFTPQDGSVARKFIPFSAFDSNRPEDLWKWLEKTKSETGADFIAIPHNSNISSGRMFMLSDSDGQPITTAYAKTRMKWEPVVEITQIKGDSETHPVLSPEDKFADFETYSYLIKGNAMGDGSRASSKVKPADYVRSALKRGLRIERKIGLNPYKFGVIGSTDSHTALSTAEEGNFWGKFSIDSTPATKSKETTPGVTGWSMSAAGLAGVWAKENTRAAIAAAFKRKEVYGTSGPRIKVRFFGGWDFQAADAKSMQLAKKGYRKGVPMGGDLTMPARQGNLLAKLKNRFSKGLAPTFLIQAVKDARGANLDRIQVVKGWVDKNGKAKEKVYDVAFSKNRKGAKENNITLVGNTVDTSTARWDNSIGSPELATVWRDPDFDPTQRAFYYARVLQIPTPRNSLYDSVALKKSPPKKYKKTIQERAYTSPIWYTPNKRG